MLQSQTSVKKAAFAPNTVSPKCNSCGSEQNLVPPFEEVIKRRVRFIQLCQSCYNSWGATSLPVAASDKTGNLTGQNKTNVNRLEAARQSKELSRTALSRKAGVDPKIIGGLEEGRQKARKATLEKLAQVLELRQEELADFALTTGVGERGSRKPQPRIIPNQGATSFIRQYRMANNLTQQELADVIGVRRQAICALELGTGGVGKKLLAKISAYLNIPLHELIANKNVQITFTEL